MGYRKITNLDKNHPLFLFKEVYASEKIHGTSTRLDFTRKSITDPWELKVFSGGIKHPDFLAMLQTRYKTDNIIKKLTEMTLDYDVLEITIYGEGYGGKCQKMSDVYGSLNFIAFEVQRSGYWLDIEKAAKFCEQLGLPFVHFEKGPATIEWINEQRDKPSKQAERNGFGVKYGEGIVIRAPLEFQDQNGGRLIAKHKRAEFKETATQHELTDEEIQAKEDANEIAEEYVVEHRLDHVLGSLVAKGHTNLTIKDTGLVIKAMVDDVVAEAKNIVWTSDAAKAIGKRAASLFKKRLSSGGIINPIEGVTAGGIQ